MVLVLELIPKIRLESDSVCYSPKLTILTLSNWGNTQHWDKEGTMWMGFRVYSSRNYPSHWKTDLKSCPSQFEDSFTSLSYDSRLGKFTYNLTFIHHILTWTSFNFFNESFTWCLIRMHVLLVHYKKSYFESVML